MNDKSLDQLIASIKSEGIAAAKKEADKIVGAAQLHAKKIVEVAEKKRDTLISSAEKEAVDLRNKGENALKQAGRDYVISVRNQLLKMFQAVFEAETEKQFDADLMKTAIVKVIEHIGTDDVELKLSPKFCKDLADFVHSHLKSSQEAVSIVEDQATASGFVVSKKGEGWSYTISPKEVATGLENHLNRDWAHIIDKEI